MRVVRRYDWFAWYAVVLATACSGSSNSDVSGARIELDRRFVEFGLVLVDDETERFVRVTNLTPAPLDLNQTITTDPSFDEVFQVRIDDPVIAAGDESVLRITFAPTAVVEYRGTLTITAPEATPQTIVPHGFGFEQSLSVNTSSLTFGTVVAGANRTRTLMVENRGASAKRLVFGGENVRPCASNLLEAFCYPPNRTVGPGETIPVDIMFVPFKLSGSTGRLDIGTCTAPICQVPVELLGFGVETALTCASERIEFGPVKLGHCRSQTVRCDNVASSPIEILGVKIGPNPPNPAFRVEDNQTTVAPDGFIEATVKYCPDDAGNDNASLIIRTDDPVPRLRNRDIPLFGIAGGPALTIAPAEINYGLVSTIVPAPRTLVITNSGSERLEIDAFDVDLDQTGAFTVEQGPPDILAPGASAQVVITMTVTTPGVVRSRLRLRTNDLDVPEHIVDLSGEGIDIGPCRYTVRPTTLDFFDVPPLRSHRRSLLFTNTGPNECLLTEVHLDASSHPGFQLLDAPTSSVRVAPGAQTAIDVSFTPTEVSQQVGRIHLASSSTVAPVVSVVIRGRGVDNVMLVAPDDIDFGQLDVGCGAAVRTVRVHNLGTTSAFVGSVALVEPIPAGLTVLPVTPDTVVSPDTPLELTIGFDPTNAAPFRAALAIVGSIRGAPFTHLVALRGAGGALVNVESFVQLDAREADILFIVDSSETSRVERGTIAEAFTTWTATATALGVDYQIAVVTTDLGRDRGRMVHAAATNNLFSGAQDTKIVTAQSLPAPETIFARNFTSPALPADSFANAGLEASRHALTALLLATDNAGFLRPNASLAVVFVSDDSDASSRSVDVYVDALRDLKGYRATRLFAAHAIVGDIPNGCTGANGAADAAQRYSAVVERSSGRTMSICAPDLGATMQSIAPLLFGLRDRFRLAAPAAASSISVTVDGVANTDWTFDQLHNTVIFDAAAVPRPGTNVDISYRGICGGT